MARPTKYKPEYCEELINFFNQEPYTDVQIDHFDKKTGEIVVWTDFRRMPNKLPTLRDFAKSIDVAVSALYRWIDEKEPCYHKEFKDAFTRAQDIRKWFLIQNGLQGLYNPLFAKFVAVNVTDMRDKQEHIVDDRTEKEKLTVEEIKERLKSLKDAGTGLAK